MSTTELATDGIVSYTLLINGSAADQEYRIYSVTVNREVNRIPTAKIVLLDGEAATQSFEASDKDDFKPGTEIEIQAGYEFDEATIFKGIIVRHGLKVQKGKPSVLTLECKDKAIKMTLGRNSQYFYEVKDSDMMEELIGNYGLSAEVEATQVTHKEFVKYHCTDWDFLITRAEANGQIVLVEDGTVKVGPPDATAQPEVELQYGLNVMEFEAEADARDQLGNVEATSWDAAGQEMISAEGSDPSANDQGNLSASDLSDVAAPDPWELDNAGQVIDEELQAWADASLLKSRMSKVRGWVRHRGLAEVMPGGTVKLGGMGERFSGDAFVSAVRHQLSDGTWMTYTQFGLSPEWFALKTPIHAPKASGLLPGISGLHIGIVTALQDDPDGEDRILVKVPSISADEDGTWMRIAKMDAGDNRGAMWLPEIEDEVVVGYLNDDPRNGIVLGMLHSSAKPAPIPGSDDNHEKGIITREQLKVLFNDDLKTIEVVTPNGNSVLLTDDEGAILIEDENGNKASFNSDGISLESAKDINIKATGDVNIEGVNINIAASAQLAADGGAGSEFTSSAVTVVKGSLVQIN